MQDYEELTLVEMVAALRAGEFSATEALEAHLARIDAVNARINAVVTLDAAGAREQARAADARLLADRRAGSVGPPLLGVPMTHKDSLPTKGMRTTFGSPLFRDNVPAQSALIIERLEAAGVVSTGKTNVPEFAAGSHTFNRVFGTTYNPYDLSRSAGGSSGGVAAAIAAGIQPAGDGSDTGGSLRTPGSFCNLVGFRPSQGRIPMLPSRNPWVWMARQGFLARTVDDVRYLMAAVAGPHPSVPDSLPLDGAFADDPGASVAGLRVGFTADFGLGLPVEPEVLDVFAAAVPVWESLGARVAPDTPDFSDADEVFQTVRAFDFAAQFAELLPDHAGDMKEAMVWNVEKGIALRSADLAAANAARARLHEACLAFFARHDLLVTPAVQVAPFDADLEFPTEVAGVATPNYLDWMRAATLVSATGLPCLSVPAGFTPGGLPVGLQIVAPHGADRLLLRAAEAFERATGHAAVRPPL